MSEGHKFARIRRKPIAVEQRGETAVVVPVDIQIVVQAVAVVIYREGERARRRQHNGYIGHIYIYIAARHLSIIVVEPYRQCKHAVVLLAGNRLLIERNGISIGKRILLRLGKESLYLHIAIHIFGRQHKHTILAHICGD